MSIKPRWCELIASGKKTVEVRKTKPKLEVPFKVYIYETKDNRYENICVCGWKEDGTKYIFKNHCGKVIGEFVCDRVGYVRNYGDAVDLYDCIASCLSAKEIIEYATDKNGNFIYTYGWHISNLVIYDKPRELGEFYTPEWFRDCEKQCDDMERMRCPTKDSQKVDKMCGWCRRGGKPITRPPQSWMYCEEVMRWNLTESKS